MDSRAIAARYFELLRRKDVAGIAAMTAADVTMVGPMQTHRGRADVMAKIAWFMPILDGVVVRHLCAEGPVATAIWTFVGAGPIGPVRMCEVLTVEAGLIGRIEAIYDTSTFAAVGVHRLGLQVA